MTGRNENKKVNLTSNEASITTKTTVQCTDDTASIASDEQELFADTDDVPKFESLDDCVNEACAHSKELFSILDLVRGRKKSKENSAKRQKLVDLKPITFVRFNTRMGKTKPVTIKALLDSGGSGTLVTEKYTKKLRCKETSATTVWTTPGGALSTTRKCQAQFTLPELHDNRLIAWDVHVTKSLGAYDMIIGRDILMELISGSLTEPLNGMVILFHYVIVIFLKKRPITSMIPT